MFFAISNAARGAFVCLALAITSAPVAHAAAVYAPTTADLGLKVSARAVLSGQEVLSPAAGHLIPHGNGLWSVRHPTRDPAFGGAFSRSPLLDTLKRKRPEDEDAHGHARRRVFPSAPAQLLVDAGTEAELVSLFTPGVGNPLPQAAIFTPGVGNPLQQAAMKSRDTEVLALPSDSETERILHDFEMVLEEQRSEFVGAFLTV